MVLFGIVLAFLGHGFYRVNQSTAALVGQSFRTIHRCIRQMLPASRDIRSVLFLPHSVLWVKMQQQQQQQF